MEFMSKVRTSQFRWYNKTIGQFMTPSKITFQFMVLDHIWISLSLPLMIFPPPKIYQYLSDPLPAAIYFTSGNSVSMFTTTFYYPQLIVLYSDDPDNQRTIMSDNPFYIGMKEECWSSFHDGKICDKILRFDFSLCSINKKVCYCHWPVKWVHS